jgi:predicted RNA-binding protein YlqC (UPF0109 family)
MRELVERIVLAIVDRPEEAVVREVKSGWRFWRLRCLGETSDFSLMYEGFLKESKGI